jgi:hypothetical protein
MGNADLTRRDAIKLVGAMTSGLGCQACTQKDRILPSPAQRAARVE